MPQHAHVVTRLRPPDTLQQLLYSRLIMEGCSHLDYHFRFTSVQFNLDLATSNPLSWGGRLPSFAQSRTMRWWTTCCENSGNVKSLTPMELIGFSYSLFLWSFWSMTTPIYNTQRSCSMPPMPQHVHVVTGRGPPDSLQQLLYSRLIMEWILQRLQCMKGCSHLDYHFRFTSVQFNLDLATSNPLSWGGRLPSFAQSRTMHWHWNAKTTCCENSGNVKSLTPMEL